MPNRLDSAETLSQTCESTWIVETEFHAEHPSTNDRGLEIAKANHAGQALPLLILAEKQTAGRGRGENIWWATEGALTFSLLLDPVELGFPPERWGTLSLATAMAVSRTLLKLCPDADVAWKWPNDVFVGDRKICGILLEAPSSRPPRMVIGVGVNVNNEIDDIASLDEQLRKKTVSLSSLLGRDTSLAEFLRSFLKDFEDVVAELRKDPLHLTQMWSVKDYLRGKPIELQAGTKDWRGIAKGVDATGAILIETQTGETKAIPGGVVKLQS